ncbi:MAG: phage/plasmid primase, P4 family [Prevotella sp.]|nr:phage/plasmid primase, P4 family [Alistipes senegalensis]MCM1357898.1 phage/plasmid primase, P4 family [Prevotella sp.]MCM1473866.1 phage/plasmid primase, P4 family [Muribaculaceae bacterium]
MILDTQQERNFNDFTSHFEVKKTDSNGEITAVCPSCRHEKLYITAKESSDGKPIVLMDCKHNCTLDEIMSAAGLPKNAIYLTPPRPKFEDITQQREHIYTDIQGVPVAKKRITKYLAEYTNKRGKTHKTGDKTTSWQRYDQQTGEYLNGLNGLKMPLYHLHKLSQAETVIIVEGEKDVETLERMGYTATSSPNGAGAKWKSDYNKYLTGKSCIVLTDNDKAGENAGIQTAESLVKINIPVKLIRAAEIYKNVKKKDDISDIVEAVGIEKAVDLLHNAITNATEYISVPLPVIPSGQTAHTPKYPDFFVFSEKKQDYIVHSALCAEYIRKNEKYCFTENSDSITQRIYWYSNGVYSNITFNRLQAYITDIIASYDPLKVRMKDVNEISKNVCADIHRYRDEKELNADESIINFRNGILHLDTMELTPHTPDIFSSIQIPCDFKGEQATPIFDKFFNEFTDGDKEKQQLLLEFVGAAVSNVHGYRFRGHNGNSLFLVGEGRTGKSVLKRFVEKLIGEDNCSNGDLQDLEQRFGAYNIYNKRLYGNSDAGFMPIKELKIFKQLTGGDSIMIEGKCRDPFNYTFKGFLWFCCNQLPKFGGDRGEHVYNRIIPVACTHRVSETERDANLVDKLVGESSGIIYKAIQALKVAITNGYNFSVPKSSKQLLETYKVQNSPYLLFFEECCVTRPSRRLDSVTTKVLHDVMIQWCRDNTGLQNPKVTDFKKEIVQYLKMINEKDLIKKSNGKQYYYFTLTTEIKEAYHIFDSVQ